MKIKYFTFAVSFLYVIAVTHQVFAQGGNQNPFKPAVFPISPTTPPPAVPTQFDINGHIQNAVLDHSVCPNSAALDKRLWGGRVTVNGVEIIIPCNTILQMPATSLTWAELFILAPVSVDTWPGSSGLALDDIIMKSSLLPIPAYEIHIQGNIVNDSATGTTKHIAGLVFISQQALNLGQGYIKSIDYNSGELCVSSGLPNTGLQGQATPNPPCLSPDSRVRINDAIGRFGLIHGGPGCKSQGTCDVEESHYDQRFTADTDNPTIHAATGFPMCIPRAYPFGATGDTDALCPQQNRPKQGGSAKCTNIPVANGVIFPAFPAQKDGYCHSFVMDPLPTNPMAPPGTCGTLPDPNGGYILNPCVTRADLQAPFEIGDYIDYSGTLLVDANALLTNTNAAPYYVSAHTINAHVGIYTYPGTKPVYVMIESLLAGTNALPIQNIPQEVTSRIKVEGFTTDPSTPVDIFAMDVDKTNGLVTERLLTSGVNPSGPPVIGRVRFVPAAGNFTPPTRNMRIVSRTLCNSRTMPCFMPQAYLDPKNPAGKYANGLVAGQYNAPNFEYIFPENLFLGDPVLPNNFQDLAFLACGSGPLTTITAGTNSPIVDVLDPPPWAQPMPASSQCAGALANHLSIPATQTPDTALVASATWDNKQNKGKLTVIASSSLPNTTPNLQLYVQATAASGALMANDPQPMQLISNPLCPLANNPCWQYVASGTVVDPLHPRGNPSLPTNIYSLPVSVTVYSSRGGIGTRAPTLICGIVNGINTCQF
ncbi:MAG: hypothetical protein NTY69_02615 [Methylococcales bacterium]|nr:hypothetical protein [Methylococcales bacterium]